MRKAGEAQRARPGLAATDAERATAEFLVSAARAAPARLLSRRRIGAASASAVPQTSGGVHRPLSSSPRHRSRPRAPLWPAAAAQQARQSRPRSPEPTGQPADFPPRTAGTTLNDLASMADRARARCRAERLAAAQGPNRFGFALLTPRASRSPALRSLLYTARQDGSACAGPYIARSESLAVKPQFQSQTICAATPARRKSVYVADVPFKRNGSRRSSPIAKL